jgi:hypothetical protein
VNAEKTMRGRIASQVGRWAALLALALVTVPTLLSLAVLPWVVWLAAELGRPWPAAVAVGLVAAIAAFLVLGAASGYYRLRPFEVSGAVYECLGVRLFRRFVVSGDYFSRLAVRYDPDHRGVRSLAALRQAERCGRSSERAHVAGALSLLPPIGCAILVGRYDLALALGLVNVLCNVYPVMLQRYTRGRLQALMTRRGAPRPGRSTTGPPAEPSAAADRGRL